MQLEAPTSASFATFSQGQDLLARRQIKEALHCFDAAERAGHAVEQCAAARWYCWMLLGNFERAWQESALIASTGCEDPNRFWDGRVWEGQRVMLRCLHGLGDTIQFIRYAPLLKETCRSLTVQAHPELVTLLACVPGIDRVCSWGPDYFENNSEWDMQMEVTELPRAFRTELKSIPAATPYIHIPKERIEWGAGRLKQSENVRVGIVWQASTWDVTRSIAPKELAPLLTCSGCSFYSLQKYSDAATSQTPHHITDLAPYLSSVRATAAFMLNLDLIVTVDTMAAHLAGALNRRVWILLPARADWRWMLERSDTPWYPSARLFRQKTGGDWSEAIEDVRAALASEAPRPR